jgi:hypothetical protein
MDKCVVSGADVSDHMKHICVNEKTALIYTPKEVRCEGVP